MVVLIMKCLTNLYLRADNQSLNFSNNHNFLFKKHITGPYVETKNSLLIKLNPFFLECGYCVII